ncbi:MAG TPA: hypothetical protein VJU61_22935, partial [Polyangiaceae bacterium]|nr:hypothetical protein [Polyangiaceae bacterium]
RAACVPPPLPRLAEQTSAVTLSAVRRSQPPPRKHRNESRRQLPEWVAFDPELSESEVSNDVWRESLRLPTAPSLATPPEQRRSARFPTFERWLTGALYRFAACAPWQRGALSVASGALLGLGIVLCVAGVRGWQHTEPRPSAPVPHATVLPPAAARTLPPAPDPTVVPTQEPSASPPRPSASEPEPTRAVAKTRAPAKKRSQLRRQRRPHVGTWTFPRPQRRAE